MGGQGDNLIGVQIARDKIQRIDPY